MSITAMKSALSALLDIEQTTDLKRLWRDTDGKRLDVVAEEAITALRTAIQEAEACEQVDWKKCLNEAKMVYSDYLDVQEALHYLEQVFLAAGAQPAPKQEP